jgi:TrmH family RNA methyltransferase
VRRALQRGGRSPEGWSAAESPRLLEEAQRGRATIEGVLLSETAAGRYERQTRRIEAPIYVLAAKLFDELSSTQNSQGVITLLRLPEWSWSDVAQRPGLLIVLDRVSDPGNVGTIIRAGEAFGAAGVVLTVGTAAAENPKTLRASAGSLFRLPFIAGVEPLEAIEKCREAGRRLLASSAQEGTVLTAVDLSAAAVVVGSESHGVREEFVAGSERVRIPTAGVESLNAAVAAAVILYEASRRGMP